MQIGYVIFVKMRNIFDHILFRKRFSYTDNDERELKEVCTSIVCKKSTIFQNNYHNYLEIYNCKLKKTVIFNILKRLEFISILEINSLRDTEIQREAKTICDIQ